MRSSWTWTCWRAASRSRRSRPPRSRQRIRHPNLNPNGARSVTPLERARLLDTEMQLQRAWLEINLRMVTTAVRESPWTKLQHLKLGSLGISLLKHRSLWIAAVSLLLNLYRRHFKKEKS